MTQLENGINPEIIPSFPPDIQNKLIENIINNDKQKIELGYLGLFLGKDIKTPCVFILVFLLSIGALVLSGTGCSVWDKITPIITLSLGYLFSKHKKHYKR